MQVTLEGSTKQDGAEEIQEKVPINCAFEYEVFNA